MSATLQALLIPLLAGLCLAFLYIVYETGRLAMAGWQRRGRHPGQARQDLRCFTLLHWAACNPAASGSNWDIAARGLVEWPRLLSVLAPGLGLTCSLVLFWTGGVAASADAPGAVGVGVGIRALAPAVADGAYLHGAVIAPLAAGLLAGMLALIVATIRRRWLDEELAWLHARDAQQGEREARLADQLAGAGAR